MNGFTDLWMGCWLESLMDGWIDGCMDRWVVD
jgi:hypothetical protein